MGLCPECVPVERIVGEYSSIVCRNCGTTLASEPTEDEVAALRNPSEYDAEQDRLRAIGVLPQLEVPADEPVDEGELEPDFLDDDDDYDGLEPDEAPVDEGGEG